MICAILLVFFIASLTYHLEGFCKAFAKLGLILTVAGAVIDTLCEVIHITILPYLASQDPFPAHVFYGFDRLANAGGVIIANGFYCIAVLLITASLKQAQKINALTTFMGYETFLAGMIMVAGSFLNQTHIVEWSTGPTIVGYMIWTILLTRTLLQEQDSSQ